MKNRLTRGLTLIEVLIVIGIISVLSVVIVVTINPAESGRKSRDAKRISDLSTIKKAIDLTLSDREQKLTVAGPLKIESAHNIGGLDVSKYLPAVPKDPVYGVSGSVQVVNEDCKNDSEQKTNMTYWFQSTEDYYVIRTRLESNSSCSTIQNDGNSSNYYELGTDPDLDLMGD